MKFTIQAIETKKEDWKVANLIGEDGRVIENVSINKVDKNNGMLFPNFENLKGGDSIEGKLWQASSGRNYLFPIEEQVAKSLTIEERVAVLEKNYREIVWPALSDHNKRIKELEPVKPSKVAGTDMDYPTEPNPEDIPF